MITISIVTCVYNGATYIGRLFSSIEKITAFNIQHIIINDGSTDSTDEIVKEYKKRCPDNISIIYKKIDNIGLGGATDIALKMIDGDYWTWINCDDWYLDNPFEDAVANLKNTNYDFVQLNYSTYKKIEDDFVLVNEYRIPEQLKKDYSNIVKLRKRLYSFSLDYVHYLVRTSSFKKINNKMSIFPFKGTQDVQLAYQIYGNLKGSFLIKPVVAFYDRNDSLFNKSHYDMFDYVNAGIKSLELLSISTKIINQQVKLSLAGYYGSLLFNSFLKGNYEDIMKLTSLCKKYQKGIFIKNKRYLDKKVQFIIFVAHLPLGRKLLKILRWRISK